MPVGTWRKAAIPATLPQGPQGQGSTSWRSPRNQRCQAWLSMTPRVLLPLAARTGQSSGQFALLRLRAQERGQATNYRSRLGCRVMKWDREKKMSSMDPTAPDANPRREKQSSEPSQTKERQKKKRQSRSIGGPGGPRRKFCLETKGSGAPADGGAFGEVGEVARRRLPAPLLPQFETPYQPSPTVARVGEGAPLPPPTPAPVPHFRMWPTPRPRLARLPPPARILTIRLSLISPSSLSTLREPAQLRPPSSPR